MTQALAMSASDFTFAIAVQNIVWGLAQAPLGAIADRWGLRPVMVLGAMAYVAAMAVAGGRDRCRDIPVGTGVDRHRHRLHRIVAGDDGGRARRVGLSGAA